MGIAIRIRVYVYCVKKAFSIQWAGVDFVRRYYVQKREEDGEHPIVAHGQHDRPFGLRGQTGA